MEYTTIGSMAMALVSEGVPGLSGLHVFVAGAASGIGEQVVRQFLGRWPCMCSWDLPK